ncbi:MAG: hypothetical protein DDT40_01440 [candidate division WS2 bacterium]|nr:hypothetical protein [Candidatus Psychracetigena formicireducens]
MCLIPGAGVGAGGVNFGAGVGIGVGVGVGIGVSLGVSLISGATTTSSLLFLNHIAIIATKTIPKTMNVLFFPIPFRNFNSLIFSIFKSILFLFLILMYH